MFIVVIEYRYDEVSAVNTAELKTRGVHLTAVAAVEDDRFYVLV